MYNLIITESYQRLVEKWIKKHTAPKVKLYTMFLQVLEINPWHTTLRLNKLKGQISEFYSVTIDMQARTVIDYIVSENDIILLKISDCVPTQSGHE